jgi:peptidoglycan hydrolase-like amidase
LLASEHAWELAAPPAVAATARTVLAGNGHIVSDQYFTSRGG